MGSMTNTEIHERIDELIAADRLEEASALVDQLEPISAEESARIFAEAPIDDEPLSPELARRLDEARETIRRLFPESDSVRHSG